MLSNAQVFADYHTKGRGGIFTLFIEVSAKITTQVYYSDDPYYKSFCLFVRHGAHQAVITPIDPDKAVLSVLNRNAAFPSPAIRIPFRAPVNDN